MKDLKKVRASRISNPIPEAERIFKCRRCKDHKYMTEYTPGHLCKACEKSCEKAVDAGAEILEEFIGAPGQIEIERLNPEEEDGA